MIIRGRDKIVPTPVGSTPELETSTGFTVPFATGDYTTSGPLEDNYLPLGRSNLLTAEAWKTLVNTPDPQLASNAESLLREVEVAIEGLGRAGYDSWNLPILRAFAPQDNSLIFEWTSSKFRVGLSIERDPNESGWYVVSTRDLHQLGASGHLAPDQKSRLVPWLLRFVADNS
jgi:hypothetical protein